MKKNNKYSVTYTLGVNAGPTSNGIFLPTCVESAGTLAVLERKMISKVKSVMRVAKKQLKGAK